MFFSLAGPRAYLRRFALGCVFLILTSAAFGTRSEAASATPFQVGEKLTYHFYWGLFMVARGTFEVVEIDPRGCHLFSVRVLSNEFISSIFPVDVLIRSYFDLQGMRSVQFEQNRHEGKKHVWEGTCFHYDLGQGSTESYLTGEKKWFEIPKEGVQDKLSTIYFMRCLNWKDRDAASTTVGNDKENYKVRMAKLKTEIREMDDFQPIPTFQVEPNTEYLSGFVKKGRMQVWVSDDEWKVPVHVTASLPIGEVSAALVKVEGIPGWPYHRKD